MHKKAALWTHTGSTYRVILCAVSSWSGFSWSNFQCFMSPCYFLFSQGFSPKLFCSGSVFTTWQVPYSFLFTSTLLHDFCLPSVFQIVLLADLASLSDSCSPSHFHLCAMWPSLSVITVSKWDSRNWQSISLSYINSIKSSRRTSFLLKSAYKLRHRPLQHTASLTIKMVWIFLGLCCGTTSNLFSGVFLGKAAHSYFSVRVLRDRCLQEKEVLHLWDVLFLRAVVSSSPDFV